MKTLRILAALVPALLVSGLAAQNPAPPAPPAGDSMPPVGPGRPGMMGRRAMPGRPMAPAQAGARFEAVLRGELQLNDQQVTRVQAAVRANQDRRIALMRRGMDVRRAIAGQLQPGIAANNDSLNRLLEQAGRIGVERAQSQAQLLRDLSFLTPVQRARLLAMSRGGRPGGGPRGMRGARGGFGDRPGMRGAPGRRPAGGLPGPGRGRGMGMERSDEAAPAPSIGMEGRIR